jgi:hypothetical protein
LIRAVAIVDPDRCPGSKLSIEAALHVLQPDPRARGRSAFDIERVRDGEDQFWSGFACPNADGPSLEQSGDAVLDGILHERLEQQRRHQRAFEVARQVFTHREPLTKANLLDAQVLPYEGELLFERDLAPAAEADAVAQEIRQEHAPG